MSITGKNQKKSGQDASKPDILLPAILVCTKRPDEGINAGEDSNNGEYEVIIPLIYMTEALKQPAKFYKFKFIGLRYENNNNET